MSFEMILSRYEPTIRSIARRLDGRYTVFSDDDLYQEAALDLWEKFRDKTLGADTDSFILQGCYFFMKNYIRKIYKKLDQRTSSLHETTENSGSSLAEKLEICETRQTREIIAGHLLIDGLKAVLSPREKMILEWQIKGLSIREMGKLLGISHPMVMKIIKKIRIRCAQILAQNI